MEKAVTQRTRAVVVVHPNNPTGSYVHPEEMELLNSFCRSHGLTLIVDEVFLDYRIDDHPRTSFAGNDDVLTFTLSGLSKISALPQMKVAWVATSGPGEQREAAMGTPGCHRRHILVDECSHPVGDPRFCWINAMTYRSN